MTSIPIPEELLPEANAIPDLQERVARFIKSEISRRQLQRKRYGADILQLVDQAFAEADQLKANGFSPAIARQEISQIHKNLTTS
jgi:hypothetical protein